MKRKLEDAYQPPAKRARMSSKGRSYTAARFRRQGYVWRTVKIGGKPYTLKDWTNAPKFYSAQLARRRTVRAARASSGAISGEYIKGQGSYEWGKNPITGQIVNRPWLYSPSPKTPSPKSIFETPVGRVLFQPNKNLWHRFKRGAGLLGAGVALGSAVVGGAVAIKEAITGIF